jgi:hypothetical protein
MAEPTSEISEPHVHGGRTATMTSYGSKTPDLRYTTANGTFQLREGWAGYYVKDNRRYAFEVRRIPGTSTPLFVVKGPDNREHAYPTPTTGWGTSGYAGLGTRVAGTTMFLLNSPILADMNDTSCGICHKEPRTVAEMKQ